MSARVCVNLKSDFIQRLVLYFTFCFSLSTAKVVSIWQFHCLQSELVSWLGRANEPTPVTFLFSICWKEHWPSFFALCVFSNILLRLMLWKLLLQYSLASASWGWQVSANCACSRWCLFLFLLYWILLYARSCCSNMTAKEGFNELSVGTLITGCAIKNKWWGWRWCGQWREEEVLSRVCSWRLNGRVRFAWSTLKPLTWPLTSMWEFELGLASATLSPFTPTCLSVLVCLVCNLAITLRLSIAHLLNLFLSFFFANCRHLVQLTNCVLIAVLNARISSFSHLLICRC